jgi:hypothetical protein
LEEDILSHWPTLGTATTADVLNFVEKKEKFGNGEVKTSRLTISSGSALGSYR